MLLNDDDEEINSSAWRSSHERFSFVLKASNPPRDEMSRESIESRQQIAF
jgi:hypothetical protein